ncbi:hypothetical protein Tco_0024552 [Tanacetum coccineum]
MWRKELLGVISCDAALWAFRMPTKLLLRCFRIMVLHGFNIVGRTKQFPHISIDDLQSSLHNWENSILISSPLKVFGRTKRSNTIKNRQEREKTKIQEHKTKRNQLEYRSPDQPDTVKLSQRKKQGSQRPKLQVKGPLLSSVQSLRAYFEDEEV